MITWAVSRIGALVARRRRQRAEDASVAAYARQREALAAARELPVSAGKPRRHDRRPLREVHR